MRKRTVTPEGSPSGGSVSRMASQFPCSTLSRKAPTSAECRRTPDSASSARLDSSYPNSRTHCTIRRTSSSRLTRPLSPRHSEKLRFLDITMGAAAQLRTVSCTLPVRPLVLRPFSFCRPEALPPTSLGPQTRRRTSILKGGPHSVIREL